ncbi:hypothetical protein SAY86_023454 [Trapa natans]|uniref:Pentatricopeptide repeat-containing protein n=1 Tax=Trapa natans TaxID=22666 RepID=A0AAN7LXB5_TRANT|nr:hypothetical protein SAY86_023454 [Trapa natans]
MNTIGRVLVRRLSTGIHSATQIPSFASSISALALGRKVRSPIPVPYRAIAEPTGQDLDFVNVAHSHLIHSDWDKLDKLSAHLTPFRVKHILLKIQKDYVLSLEFFDWAELRRPNINTLETQSIILHILTKNRKFRSAESILKSMLVQGSGDIDLPGKLFNALLYSYRLCDSSPRAFDALFKTFAHLKKLRNASDTFHRMRDYGFLPNVKSCNAYLSSSLGLDRADIVLSFYREMGRSRISPNEYTLNMVISALCMSGKLDKAVDLFGQMECRGYSPSVASYNVLIAGQCNRGLLSSAMKLKNMMEEKGVYPDAVTFNTFINGFCKMGKLNEANEIFAAMKASNIAPSTVTYNTLIYGYSQVGNSEIGARLFEEMSRYEVKADLLTYNALILGYCKEGKTKKAAYLVKELDKKGLVPNASTFSALIQGQCVRGSPERALLLYRSMIKSGCHPDDKTLNVLLGSFCNCKDADGAVEVLREMMHRSMAPHSGTISDLFHELKRQGRDRLALDLCSELEARRLIREGFHEILIYETSTGARKVNPDEPKCSLI